MYFPKELLLLVISTLCQLTSASNLKDGYSEHLSIKPLKDGKVATRFTFNIHQPDLRPRNPELLANEDRSQHYSLFPLGLGQVLRDYAVTEMHLSLNSGKWDYGRWGYPEDPAVASGAELWAWMGDSKVLDVDERWKGLRNSLSGLFCASIGSLDELRTTAPTRAFRPEGALPLFQANATYQLRHAMLPSENVCTENLTPFLKQLPCKSSAGIASLLNPHRLFDADWHGLSVHVTWDRQRGVQLQLSVQSVFDPVRLSASRQRDFSLSSLFDRTITHACPVASDSKVEVYLPRDIAYAITPEPTSLPGHVGVYDISLGREWPLDVSLKHAENVFSYPLDQPSPPLTDFEVTRTLTGASQAQGRLRVTLQNNREHDIDLHYVETMPWLVTFYLHTLALTVDGVRRDGLISDMVYIPPEAHGRPTLFEARLTLPAAAKLEISMDVVKGFLRYTEHPPDAQRGWDLPPAILIPITNSSASSTPQSRRRVYTRTLLVDVATPDFSMPYNVIIMSSTLIVFIFGSIFNLFTRSFVLMSVDGVNAEKCSSTQPTTAKSESKKVE